MQLSIDERCFDSLFIFSIEIDLTSMIVGG